jgi:hypothetical protein
MYLRKG